MEKLRCKCVKGLDDFTWGEVYDVEFAGRVWWAVNDNGKRVSGASESFDPIKEPVSEKLEQAVDVYLKSYWGGEKEKQDWPFLKKMAIHFADWQKEQIEEALLSEVLPCFMHGGEADEVVAKLDEVLNQKK